VHCCTSEGTHFGVRQGKDVATETAISAIMAGRKVEVVGRGCSVVSRHSSAWEMRSCTNVDDIECDGVFAKQILPKSGVSADGSGVDGAPVRAIVVAMIVVV
jgi:hypothetical protein